MTPSPSKATENWLGRGTQKEYGNPLDWVLKANAEADSLCKGLVQEIKAIRLMTNGVKDGGSGEAGVDACQEMCVHGVGCV